MSWGPARAVVLRRLRCARGYAQPRRTLNPAADAKHAAAAARGGDNCVRLAGGDIPVTLQHVQLGGSSFAMPVMQPESSDAVIDWYIESGREASDPFWAITWPSSIALAEHLLRCPQLVQGRGVVELGCGTGVVGVGCLHAGASRLLFTDAEPVALQCALLTAAANGFVSPSATQFSPSPEEAGQVAALERQLKQRPVPVGQQPVVDATRLDWGGDAGVREQCGGPFDVVVASDVLYDAEAPGLLAPTVMQLLAGKAGARLLLANPVSRPAQLRRSFFQSLLALGGTFMVEVDTVVAVQQLHHFPACKQPQSSRTQVQLVVLRQAQASETLGKRLESLLQTG